MEVHSFYMQEQRTGIANTDTALAQEAVHPARRSREDRRSRLHCTLVFSTRPQQGIQMARLLCQFVATPQLQQVTEPWTSRQRAHRGRPARRNSKGLEGALRREDQADQNRLRGSSPANAMAGTQELDSNISESCNNMADDGSG